VLAEIARCRPALHAAPIKRSRQGSRLAGWSLTDSRRDRPLGCPGEAKQGEPQDLRHTHMEKLSSDVSLERDPFYAENKEPGGPSRPPGQFL